MGRFLTILADDSFVTAWKVEQLDEWDPEELGWVRDFEYKCLPLCVAFVGKTKELLEID